MDARMRGCEDARMDARTGKVKGRRLPQRRIGNETRTAERQSRSVARRRPRCASKGLLLPPAGSGEEREREREQEGAGSRRRHHQQRRRRAPRPALPSVVGPAARLGFAGQPAAGGCGPAAGWLHAGRHAWLRAPAAPLPVSSASTSLPRLYSTDRLTAPGPGSERAWHTDRRPRHCRHRPAAAVAGRFSASRWMVCGCRQGQRRDCGAASLGRGRGRWPAPACGGSRWSAAAAVWARCGRQQRQQLRSAAATASGRPARRKGLGGSK